MKNRFRYLHQLVITTFLIFSVPILCFFLFFWERAFKEMKHSNMEYYESALSTFSGEFLTEIGKMRSHAAGISVDSRSLSGASAIGENVDVLRKGVEKLRENPWYYQAAAQELRGYYKQDLPAVYFGLYYYEEDCVLITDMTKYSALEYVMLRLGITDVEKQEELLTFFEEKDEKMVLASDCVPGAGGGYILIGFPVLMGEQKDHALIFYVLEQEKIKISSKEDGIRYSVWNYDTGQFLGETGGSASSDREENYFTVREKEASAEKKLIQTHYEKERPPYHLIFCLDVEEDALQNSVIRFYYEMRTLLIIMGILMLMICVLSIYLNYRPVYRIVGNMKEKGRDEFSLIANRLDEQNLQLSEQRFLIMDLLMGHLLQGTIISPERVERLGISPSIRYYCVFLIEKQVLLTYESNEILKRAQEKFHTLLFITDLQGKKETAVISFMEEENAGEIAGWLEQWCREHLEPEYGFYAGTVVSDMNDIRKSLQSCYQKRKIPGRSKEKLTDTGKQESLKQEILQYLDLHYREEDLSQTLVADIFQISSYTLSRMFKNQVGIGFTEYINAKRLEYAKELLLTTSYSVKEISVIVGIPNDNYFSRMFKANIGMTPSEFRNQI